MDITTMRIVATLAQLVCFIGIWVWAYIPPQQVKFDEAAATALRARLTSTRTRKK
jgi:cytochrome c oxidase cbb3-type subunit 4